MTDKAFLADQPARCVLCGASARTVIRVSTEGGGYWRCMDQGACARDTLSQAYINQPNR